MGRTEAESYQLSSAPSLPSRFNSWGASFAFSLCFPSRTRKTTIFVGNFNGVLNIESSFFVLNLFFFFFCYGSSVSKSVVS